jgi:BirA family biotin operon repressor/biotin-[acetyl-CoA-carboxylase] ligase
MLDIQNIKSRLKTERIGRQIYHYEEVDSTNVLGHQMVQTGLQEGALLITEFQTAGKGRLGRNWHAAKGENILMSIILKPKILANEIHLITFLSAIVVIKAIQSLLKRNALPDMNLKVKWPNDVMVKGKKIAGILSESKCTGQIVEYMIIGIGINVNQIFDAAVNDLGKKATSVRMECSKIINRDMLLYILITQYDNYYLQASSENYKTVIQDWKGFWDGQYMRVKIDNGRSFQTGVVEDIEHDGRLLLKTETGCLTSIASGELISWN